MEGYVTIRKCVVKQHRLLAYLEELFDRFWGTGENNLVTFLDEWALDKIRLFGEDIQQLVIGELRLCEIEPFINVLQAHADRL